MKLAVLYMSLPFPKLSAVVVSLILFSSTYGRDFCATDILEEIVRNYDCCPIISLTASQIDTLAFGSSLIFLCITALTVGISKLLSPSDV
jgi:hypothetical protein